MGYNPSTRIVLHVKDDTYIKASPVGPSYIDTLGTVRVVVGTSIELYLTPTAAALLIAELAQHVDEVLAVITAAASPEPVLRPDWRERLTALDADEIGMPPGEVLPDVITTSAGISYPVGAES